MEKNLIYSQSDMKEMNKGILSSFIMEAVNPTPVANDELIPATEAAKSAPEDADAAEDDDLYDDAENDEDISDDDVFITEIDGDDDPCEEEDDFYDSVVESVEGESIATESTNGSDNEYISALESAVYELNEMSEDQIIGVLESLDPETVQDLVAVEQSIMQSQIVMEDCDEDTECDDIEDIKCDDECDDDDEDDGDEVPDKKKIKRDKNKINGPIKVNTFSTVLNPVNTFENTDADDYVDLFDDDEFDDDDDDDL